MESNNGDYQSDVTYVALQWDSMSKRRYKLWEMPNTYVPPFPIVPGYRGLLLRRSTGQKEGALIIAISDRLQDLHDIALRYFKPVAHDVSDQEVPTTWVTDVSKEEPLQVVPS